MVFMSLELKNDWISNKKELGHILHCLVLKDQESFSFLWGYSSAGRAPALQAGGQRFDPAYLHQFFKQGLIAQAVRAHAW